MWDSYLLQIIPKKIAIVVLVVHFTGEQLMPLDIFLPEYDRLGGCRSRACTPCQVILVGCEDQLRAVSIFRVTRTASQYTRRKRRRYERALVDSQ